MGDAWSAEYWRLGLVFFAVLTIGVLTGYWYVAWILPLSLYIAWHLRQLYFLESWLRKGTKTKKAPESGGVWALIVQQIYRHRQQERVHKKRLASTLGRFNATTSALPDATIVLNKSHEIEWVNQAAGDLLGIERKRDPGLRIETLIRTPAFHKWMNSPIKGKRKDLEMVSPLDQKNMLALRLVKFGKGQLLLTARDISQRVQLQQMRKAFIANASHELRTPLTVIAGYLEVLENADDLPDSFREPVVNANAQARRMQQIIEDLLSLSQLEAGDLAERNGKKLNVSALLQQLIDDLQKTLALDTHTLEFNVDSDLKIRAVESEFISLALNLIKNAIRHTPTGTTVHIGWQKSRTGEACLSVKDDGPGIGAEHIPKLTERFYLVNPGRSRDTGGTGLGLSIVEQVMQRHGGRLVIQSAPGDGSMFIACFPQYRTLS